MARSVFVRGFAWETTEQELVDHLSQVGTVEAIQFKQPGTAIATYFSEDEAKRAIAELDGGSLVGSRRWLEVREFELHGKGSWPARPAQNDWNGGGFKRKEVDIQAAPWHSDGGKTHDWAPKRPRAEPPMPAALLPQDGNADDGHSVYVLGFDFGTEEELVNEHFSTAGLVLGVQMRKGAAVVTYSSREEAENAVETLQHTVIPGNQRYIEVRLDGRPPRARADRPVYRSSASMVPDSLEQPAEEYSEADAEWKERLAEAWQLFSAARTRSGRTLSAWLGGLPPDAQTILEKCSRKAWRDIKGEGDKEN